MSKTREIKLSESFEIESMLVGFREAEKERMEKGIKSKSKRGETSSVIDFYHNQHKHREIRIRRWDCEVENLEIGDPFERRRVGKDERSRTMDE